jgi:hypothetical protein
MQLVAHRIAHPLQLLFMALRRLAARSRAISTGRAGGVTHQAYFFIFFRSAQRAFIAAEIRFRAAADIMRRLVHQATADTQLS